jgi:hypothetical protein
MAAISMGAAYGSVYMKVQSAVQGGYGQLIWLLRLPHD